MENNIKQNNNEEFENWSILEGIVVCSPVKVRNKKEIYYNFKLDNNKFKMNCTITIYEENKELEDEIFKSIIEGEVIKVAGILFLKKKNNKLWIQINVRNWTDDIDGRKELHKLN